MSAYRRFIGEMAALARRCVIADRIRLNGHAERGDWPESPLGAREAQRKAFLLSLSPGQREMLAGLIEAERVGAVHDVLAHLEWKASAGGLLLGEDGERFLDAARETFHGDFMAALSDD